MLCEDGNGQSEIVAAFTLAEENEISVLHMVEVFKKYNDKWNSVREIMADKDMTERAMFASAFLSARLLICLFHTFQSFGKKLHLQSWE